MHHHTWLILFLVEAGCHHIGQAGLQLLTSGDLATSASQSAGITGVSHRAQSQVFFLSITTSPRLQHCPQYTEALCPLISFLKYLVF